MAQQVNVKIVASAAGSALSLEVQIRNLAADPVPFASFTETVQLPTTVAAVKDRLRERIAAAVRDFNDNAALAVKATAAAAAVNGTQYDLVV